MEDKKRSQKKKILGIVIISGVALTLLGSWAWYSSQQKIENTLNTGLFDVSLNETYNPEVPVIPGEDVEKTVFVRNNSTIPALVRVRLETSLQLAYADATGVVEYSKDTPLPNPGDPGTQIGYTPTRVAIDPTFKTTITGWTSVDLTQRKDVSAGGTLHVFRNANNEYAGYYTINGIDQVISLDLIEKTNPNNPEAITADVAYGYYQLETTPLTGYYVGKAAPQTYDDIAKTFTPWSGDRAEMFAKPYVTFNLNASNVTEFGNPSDSWYFESITENIKESSPNQQAYYYYGKLLTSGNTTPLLKSVSFDITLPNTMQGAKFIITPQMEAIQGTTEAAAAAGWYNENAEGSKLEDMFDGILKTD